MSPPGGGSVPVSETTDSAASVGTYADALSDYFEAHSEDALYRASLLSRTFIESGLGPEEIIAIHGDAFTQAVAGLSYREQARAATDALQFLLEVMIAYGVQHKEYLELRVAERARLAETEAEKARRMAEEARQAEQTKGEALAMIAHELRTPIAAAMGSLDLVLRALKKGEVDRVPRLLGSARDAMARLSRLTGDLMEASRGDVPALAHSPQEIVVVLAQACAWAGAVAEEKGVRVVRGGGPFSARVMGDEDALLTMLGNLLSNAIRYTPAGGEVAVQHWVEGEQVWVEVKDTGIGMPPETQARIFDQFYRSPEARAVESQGMGLGLSLVQRLLHAHNGHIEVESTVGRGSTFRIAFPLLKAPEEQILKAPEEQTHT